MFFTMFSPCSTRPTEGGAARMSGELGCRRDVS